MMAGFLLAAAVVLATTSAGAVPGDTDVRGPRCADIVDGAGFYDGTEVNFRETLAAPSCKQVTYTLYVLDEPGDTTPLATASQTGDGTSTNVFFRVAVADDDSTVCVYGTTSIGGKIFDRAPDTGCVTLAVGGGAPAGRFR